MPWMLRSKWAWATLCSVPASGLLLAACLLPSFSDVLPEPGSDAQPADGGPEGDGALAGCDDVGDALAVWPMTEGTGNVIRDCSGKYPGTFSSGVEWTTGRAGLPALRFSGGFVAIVDDVKLRLAGPFTVVAWVSPASTQVDQFGDVVARYESINAAVWGLAVTKDPQVAFTAFGPPITQQQMGGVSYGKFTHIAGTFSSTDVAVFVSGAPGPHGPGPTVLSAAPIPITIGANSVGTSAFHGVIAGVRVYSRVLDVSEINGLSLK